MIAAGSGKEAVELFSAHKDHVDLVILDMVMHMAGKALPLRLVMLQDSQTFTSML